MKLQIPTKIGGVVAVLVVSLLALAAAGLSGIASVSEQADKLATVSVKKLEAVAELRGTTAGLRADAFETVIYDAEAKHDELERTFGEDIAKAKSQLAEIRELSAGVPAESSLVDAVEIGRARPRDRVREGQLARGGHAGGAGDGL